MARKNNRIVEDLNVEDTQDILTTENQTSIDTDSHCATEDTLCLTNREKGILVHLNHIMIDMLSLISKKSLPIITLTHMM